MASEDRIPVLSFKDEPTRAGARSASDRVGAFANDHHLAAALQKRVTSVVGDVVDTLAGAVPQPPAQMWIEADIELGNLQLVITHEVDCAASVEELKPFLAVIGERCDGFAVNRQTATVVEVWACFKLV